jgi:hypothetical protein
MDFKDVVKQSLEDYGQQLEFAVDGLTPEEGRWQPSPESNHILWTLWHIGRMEDLWGSYIAGEPEVWESNGWARKFGMPLDALGVGDTPEEVASFPDVALADAIGYWKDARTALVEAIDGLSEADLPETHPENWRWGDRGGFPTVMWVLGRIPVECGQHTGQIAYIRGMQQGTEWKSQVSRGTG